MFYSKGELETAFRGFLTSKPFRFYHTGVNNLVNQWQKYIDIQGSCFNWLKQFEFINPGIRLFKIGTLFSKQPNI